MIRKPVKKKVHRNVKLVPEGERMCPICGERMHIEKIKNIPADVCEEHGLWLDKGEFMKITRRIRTKLNMERAQAVRQAKTDGKVSGNIFGMWSFLMD